MHNYMHTCMHLRTYIYVYVTGSACLHTNFDLRIFTTLKCHTLNMIWVSIVEISISIQKFLSFILIQNSDVRTIMTLKLFLCRYVKYANMEEFCRAGHIYMRVCI